MLPFVPRYLPQRWRPVSRHVAHAQSGTDAIEVWSSTDQTTSVHGIIEVWRGENIPTPTAASMSINVLGQAAQFGLISDGSSVVFTVGDRANMCDRWALVGHPNTPPEMLRTVAEHLTPVRA